MDFSVSEEQSMLADSVARFVNNDYDFETRQKIAQTDSGFSSDNWQTFAELGWTALLFPESDGGFDGGAVEMMLLMEQFGRGLLVEPFLANVVLAGGVLKAAANNEQKVQWLAPIIAGDQQAALAFTEPQSRFNLANVATRAIKNGDTFTLHGSKSVVLNGGAADLLIVAARTSGEQTSTSGISLFAVPTDSNGLTRTAYKTVDAQQAAEIEFNNVVVPAAAMIGGADGGFEVLRTVIDDATLAVCAEAIGIMFAMHEKTVEYTKNRVQFGVPIGSFQALQHRMVDNFMRCEESKSLLLWATMLRAADSEEAPRAISAMKYQIGTAGVAVAKEAVQLHGGMGVTWELDIAHYFKRMTAISLLFGDADHHLDRYVKLSTD